MERNCCTPGDAPLDPSHSKSSYLKFKGKCSFNQKWSKLVDFITAVVKVSQYKVPVRKVTKWFPIFGFEPLRGTLSLSTSSYFSLLL